MIASFGQQEDAEILLAMSVNGGEEPDLRDSLPTFSPFM